MPFKTNRKKFYDLLDGRSKGEGEKLEWVSEKKGAGKSSRGECPGF